MVLARMSGPLLGWGGGGSGNDSTAHEYFWIRHLDRCRDAAIDPVMDSLHPSLGFVKPKQRGYFGCATKIFDELSVGGDVGVHASH